jgi:crotonobetainyl-CoA:carnitine CoA-transferase CaiB-like acyl-CoA transferase
MLADLGAEVIKVERPGVGDDTRAWGPPFTTQANGAKGDAAYYPRAPTARSRSITVDMAKPEGADLLSGWQDRAMWWSRTSRPAG